MGEGRGMKPRLRDLKPRGWTKFALPALYSGIRHLVDIGALAEKEVIQ